MGSRHAAIAGRALGVTLLLGVSGCLEFSPHQLPPVRDIHGAAIARLSGAPAETLRFAVLGDTHVDLDETDSAVDALNRLADLSFVVQMGDLTNVATAGEYRLMHDVLSRLRVPYFVVIGNHDMLGNGRDVYRRTYGPFDVAFTHANTRFVLLDSNSREYGFDGSVPALAWLAEQLAPSPSFDRAVVLSHVGALSADFDPDLAEPFLRLLGDLGVDVAFHGHAHRFHQYDRYGVRYYVADAVDARTYLLVSLEPGGGFAVERVAF